MYLKKTPQPVSVRAGKIEFLRTNSVSWKWRDLYRTVLSLSWPRFGVFVLGLYLGINVAFAAAYALGGPCIAEMQRGSFADAFFFSVQTLSTVGFGHLYPATLYGHIVTTLEIIIGMFFTAVVTGLIFVRFSRPVSRLLFSDSMVICPFDGKSTLQIRVANLQQQPMVEAEFRMMLIRNETVAEGDEYRRFYALKLDFDRLIMFPSALTIRHTIDEKSPLFGITAEEFLASDSRFMASIVCIDTVTQSSVQSQADYTASDVHFGHRFAEIYTDHKGGRFEVDYGRLNDIEPL
jgi:inward rectifier potassium channel